MEPSSWKHSLLRNVLVRMFLLGVLLIGVRFAYVVTIAGESCTFGDFCFFSIPENRNLVTSSSGAAVNRAVRPAGTAAPPSRSDLYTSKDWIKAARFYSSVFRDLVAQGFLSPKSKSLCIETPAGQDVFALKEVGVVNSIGISKKASRPLVISGKPQSLGYGDDTFDFIFSGGGRFDGLSRPLEVASEITRTLKPGGFVVVHVRANDTYSFNSFIGLFNSFQLLKSHDFDGFDPSFPKIREIVLKKHSDYSILSQSVKNSDGIQANKCSLPEYKQQLVRDAEPLITEEPLKPWITLKKNLQNIKYLPTLVDISFKNRYVYVDVGARSYGSSIGSWFRKQYPKQNKTFEVYAVEADKAFHEEYKLKKRVTLLPYAAWVKNETLSFEITRDPGQKADAAGRGMGRIQTAQSSKTFDGEVASIQGFDFADWLKKSVSEMDYVVMKMDVEGTEFDLIPKLIENGSICLIDELFLECHYNRWQRCCPGERSSKYKKTYGQCLELFESLRQRGVLVHQWW
ncbi:hypothetical protein SAY87_014755 [Trapa incisa]|uniref:DUF7870 domain-containing protein n=1 Tax=Trapa incisa TaxID=236973 RepID=A0AAN7H088_9MYRT|nr:hypothetical protein SAY87_014755 [Trapa incisa]